MYYDLNNIYPDLSIGVVVAPDDVDTVGHITPEAACVVRKIAAVRTGLAVLASELARAARDIERLYEPGTVDALLMMDSLPEYPPEAIALRDCESAIQDAVGRLDRRVHEVIASFVGPPCMICWRR